jgi:N-acetylglucosaminyldiphosphoundecaprenol N-acetyl-beta-D-mannosaminyltransferase
VAGNERRTAPVLGVPIDVIGWRTALERLLVWGAARESRYVTICNAHVVVTASQDRGYYNVIAASDMATPDGAPVAWMLQRLVDANQPKISGPDLTHELLKECEKREISVYFFGSSAETLTKLTAVIARDYPGVQVAGVCSPPFRTVTEDEDAMQIRAINESGAGLVFVGLGCPKQERWMAAHRGSVHAVMLGVGAAFDFIAGTVNRAPLWMQRGGLEWLYRLASEPRRLGKRYLVTNTLFIFGAVRQLLAR